MDLILISELDLDHNLDWLKLLALLPDPSEAVIQILFHDARSDPEQVEQFILMNSLI